MAPGRINYLLCGCNRHISFKDFYGNQGQALHHNKADL
jgi:hypothetical protein